MTLVGQEELARSERQMERGQFFMHSAFAELHRRLRDAEIMLHGLTDLLLGRGLVTEQEMRRSLESVAPGLAAEPSAVGVVVGTEPEAADIRTEPVDCAARMHVCHAVCCKLDFALSVSEIEAGSARWDLGRPYFIRHEADGACTHNDPGTGRCGIYDDRPTVCHRYSCRHDERIWKDFDRMALNTGWVEENLRSGCARPRAVFLPMPVVPRQTGQGASA